MITNLIYLGIISIFILIQGFLSNSEMAMVSCNKFRLQFLVKNGNKRASIILNLLNNPHRLFAPRAERTGESNGKPTWPPGESG